MQTNGLWQVDETYVKIKEKMVVLIRCSRSDIIVFYYRGSRDIKAVKRFHKALTAFH